MYAEIHGNFTDVYRIVIACIEVEIIYYLWSSTCIFGYKSLFVRSGHIAMYIVCIQWHFDKSRWFLCCKCSLCMMHLTFQILT